jgi:arsenite methyltransferase
MIERAGQVVAEAGLQDRDIELRVSDMARSQLPDSLADVIISNCVINLCPDKDAVYEEAFRILKPGGRLAISDIVLTEKIDPTLQERFRTNWSGCLGGAITEDDYWQTVRKAGFVGIETVSRYTLTPKELHALASCPGEEFGHAPAEEDLSLVQGKVTSFKFKAAKSSLNEVSRVQG